ncbi:MAG: DUF839 domain-containing protein [Candidatus Competibacteraceae bacterium]|nr:DUF839 domain-containing protein [Candidatus Competibacteraceae bacterium]
MKMQIGYFGILLTGLAISCQSGKRDAKLIINPDTDQKNILFNPVEPDYNTPNLILPEGFTYDILFAESDTVRTANGKAPAKGNHDLIIYIPDNNRSDKGTLYVSHETLVIDPHAGDGGGATLLDVVFENGKWVVIGEKRNVDFSTVGGTVYNCGGTLTPKGTVLTAEELFPSSLSELKNPQITSLRGMNHMTKEEHMGWMVEVDPIKGEAIQKVYNFGRYTHEDAYCTPDGKTVYLTDDYCPAIFFKFETTNPNDYSSGQLYAYQQSQDGLSGRWLAMPMDIRSLIHIRDTAIAKGATMFVRQEWIQEANGKIYISETGYDSLNLSVHIQNGGTVPHYLEKNHKTGDGIYADPFGRILVFDPITLQMEVLLDGGPIEKDGGHFANPDALHIAYLQEKPYIIISEDLTGLSMGRVSKEAEEKGWLINEIYFLDLTIAKPTRNDLMRFAVGPRGCETTGSYFTPDGKTYFVNIQHPDKSNPPPFNRSTTIAIRGFP